MRILACIVLSLASCKTVLAGTYVYVSVAGEKKLAVYQMESEQGKLIHRADIAIDGEPGALTVDPDRHFLFASIRSTGELASFRIDWETGKLTHIKTVAAGADPAHLATDRTGRFLLTAYYQA